MHVQKFSQQCALLRSGQCPRLCSYQSNQPVPLCFHHCRVAIFVEFLIKESVILLQLKRLFRHWALCLQAGVVQLPCKSPLKLFLFLLQVCQPLLKPCSLKSDICRQLSLFLYTLLLFSSRMLCLSVLVEAVQCRIDRCYFPL